MALAKKILVVDDEPLARERILRMIDARSEGHQVVLAQNGFDALEHIDRFRPQIVFLDVVMPGLSGFEVLYHLPQRDFQVIFQTAHDSFAIRAFEENACDYLLKPVEQERFDRSMERVLQRLPGDSDLSGLTQRMVAGHRYLESLVVREGDVTHFVRLKDVDSLISAHHYTSIFTRSTREYLTRLSIAHFATHLSPSEFCQIHRKAIVRIDAILRLISVDHPEVVLKNGQRIAVSRSRRKALLEVLRSGGSSNKLPEKLVPDK